MQLLYRIVKNWDLSLTALQVKDFCPNIPNVRFTLKEPRHATTQLPLFVCRKIMPSAPALHRLLINQTWQAACRSLHREWGQYSLLRVDQVDTTMDIPINIWLDEPRAADMAHVAGEARQASFLSQLENANETSAEEALVLLREAILFWEVQPDCVEPLLKDETAAMRSAANPAKTPHISWADIQPFLEDASGQTLTKIQEQRSAKKKNRDEQQGKGAKRGKTRA